MDENVLCWFLDNSSLADVDLCIQEATGGSTRGGSASRPCKLHGKQPSKRQSTESVEALESIKCHKLVLCAGSPVLKRRLENWAPADNGQLMIKVASASEARAVESMVRFFYSACLPNDASPLQLLQLMVTANLYQSDKCVEACGRCAQFCTSVGRLLQGNNTSAPDSVTP